MCDLCPPPPHLKMLREIGAKVTGMGLQSNVSTNYNVSIWYQNSSSPGPLWFMGTAACFHALDLSYMALQSTALLCILERNIC